MSKEIEITVHYGKKKETIYVIDIVPNRFNVDYYEHVNQCKKILELNAELANSKTVDELSKVEEKLSDMGLEKVLEFKYNLIKTIMIANDYEYDRDFWDLRVNPVEVDNFISECALKDKPDEVKKKLIQTLKSTIIS